MYPQNPRSGVPVSLTISPQSATLAAGDNLQLSPTLTDAYGTPISATQSYSYLSSNPNLVTVNGDGLCTVASQGSGLPTGGTAEIEVSYPWASVEGATIYANVLITVTIPEAVSTPFFRTEDSAGPGSAVSGAWTNLSKVYPAA